MKTQQVQPKTQPEGHAGNKMGIDVKINSISMEGNILATASINLNQCLAIRNIRLMNGEKGMFLSMPSYRTGNGEFRDICFPITAEFRLLIRRLLRYSRARWHKWQNHLSRR